ncbi:MAG: hypothetical protein MJ118_03490 [Clostridia bacterium]|nr:hypothetical protein [Clostridia bacterium]
MIRIRDISLSAYDDMSALARSAAKQLRIKQSDIKQLDIRRRSVDARKKSDVRIIYTVDVAIKEREDKILKMARCPKAEIAKDFEYQVPMPAVIPDSRPVIVGFGPAGMFCALVLSMAGLRPIVLERGQDAETRHARVAQFWETGRLDPDCNVQFGEGGAGTFSDGKLNSGIKNERTGWILEQFADAGAEGNILYDAKPHIGTDVLLTVVQNLRKKIIHYGGEVRFGTKLTGIRMENGKVIAAEAECNGETAVIPCSQLVLAIGHSARDTFEFLYKAGIPMEPKPFSMGVRIEHKQAMVNESQYGKCADAPALGAADYKLNVKLPNGDSAYTFCMCPGGSVVAAASEDGGVVTNGMSCCARDGENANAALLVTLHPEDFPDKGVLGGMYWQREIEHAAFQAGGSNYHAPAQLVGDFLAHRKSEALGSVQPSYCPGVTLCDLHDVLPKKLTSVLEQAIPALDRYLHGYNTPDAVMTAPETRSSSPVRILRDETRQSSLRGLYPCGEGAGYAGGILSAAADGMMTAEAIVRSF